MILIYFHILGVRPFFSYDGYIEQAIIHDRFMLEVDPENPFFMQNFYYIFVC